MRKCLISCGANIPGPFGKPYQTLLRAFEEFKSEGLFIEKKSRLYSSVAFPDPKKPRYVNGCLEISANCEENDVLKRLKRIEIKMGRQKNSRWGSRICDLDLLSCDDRIYPSHQIFDYWFRLPLENQFLEKPEELLLPHPRIQDRAFVLKPLLELASNWRHPVFNLTVKEMFDFLPRAEKDSVLLI